MYLGIDIGGTKTIAASLDAAGVIKESYRFPTPKKYEDFIEELASAVAELTTKKFVAVGVGVPGKIDRERGIGIAFGNLPWRSVPIRKDVQKIANAPVVIENDANLAGLSEAMLLKHHRKVLYVTISTGIGTGFIVDRVIDPNLADSEGGNILLEHNGKLEAWEDFASGRAIAKRFGKQAREITDKHTWQVIARNIALGLIDLIALTEPDIIVLGGGVGTYYSRYREFLTEFLEEHRSPLFKIPPIQEAARPEQAVVYGCYDLARSVYGKHS
jgi:predicted NBD/HSP70 family sugar kinase